MIWRVWWWRAGWRGRPGILPVLRNQRGWCSRGRTAIADRCRKRPGWRWWACASVGGWPCNCSSGMGPIRRLRLLWRSNTPRATRSDPCRLYTRARSRVRCLHCASIKTGSAQPAIMAGRKAPGRPRTVGWSLTNWRAAIIPPSSTKTTGSANGTICEPPIVDRLMRTRL